MCFFGGGSSSSRSSAAPASKPASTVLGSAAGSGNVGFTPRTRPYFNMNSDGGREQARQFEEREMARFQRYQYSQAIAPSEGATASTVIAPKTNTTRNRTVLGA